MTSLDPALQLTLRLAVALLLLGSLQHKLRDFARFRSAVANYRVLPRRWTAAAALLLALAEGTIGVALGVGLGSVPALAAAVLLAVYTGAITTNLLRGRRDIDCGCAGPDGRRPIGEGLVVRNAFLILAALACALPSAERAWVWLDAATVVAGVAGAALLYAAIDRSLANAPGLRALGGREWSTH